MFENMSLFYKGVLAVMGAIGTYLFGGWDSLIQFLLFCMVADYATGLLKAGINKDMSSSVGFVGIGRKLGILIAVAIAYGLDNLFMDQQANIFGIEMPMIRTIVIWAYIINEVISVLENLRDSGVFIPKILQKIIIILRDKNDNSLVDEVIKKLHANFNNKTNINNDDKKG